MVNKAVAISREKLEDTLVTWDSITTADGAVGCTSLIDAGLIGKNDFVTNQVTVLVLGGLSNLEKQVAATFNSGTGTITFPAMSHRILSGTPYRLINFGAVSVSAIQSTILSDATPFPGADIALIKTQTDKIGDATIGLSAIKTEEVASTLNQGAGAVANATPLGSLVRWIADALNTAVTGLVAVVAAIKAKTDNLPASPAASGEATAALAAVAYTRQAGVPQVKATTIDLNQAANTYDLFTCATQPVMLSSLVIRMSGGAVAGAVTSISIQTNDATPQVLITAAQGAVANLLNQAQLFWSGNKTYLAVGQKIQLTIAGGAAGVAKVCDVVCEYESVVTGGTL
jgi:hypothetical protein